MEKVLKYLIGYFPFFCYGVAMSQFLALYEPIYAGMLGSAALLHIIAIAKWDFTK